MRTPDRQKVYRNSDDTAKCPDISDLDFGASNHILREIVDAVLAIRPIPEPEPESLPCLSLDELQRLADAYQESCGTSKSVSQPTPTPIDPFPAVPAELKTIPQWVVWRKAVRDGKPTKVPYQVNGAKAKTNDPSTWTDYQTVCQHAHRFDGIGFVFCAEDPLCGVDLDDCLDENRKIKPWAQPIVDRLKPVSYREISPSGGGIKYWTRAKLILPKDAKHKIYIVDGPDAIEAYDSVRYFTVTGHNGKGQIGDGQSVVDWLVSAYLTPETQPSPETSPATPKKRVAAKPSQNSQTHSYFKTADAVIDRIRQSRQCHKFDALMRGDQTGYGSQSEADKALCSVIAFWTQDEGFIDTIFRQSALYRDKWDEKHRRDGATYGEMTIEKAVSGKSETYTPRKKQRSQTRRRRRKPRDIRRKKCRS